MQRDPDYFDVVIVGGAISGASAALLLRRQNPSLRVLIVEKRVAFDAKVGEATTEMSAMFLTRRLALWQHLEVHHLPKEGLRYWSMNDRVTGHADASESGGYYRSTVPAFQLRRDVLDEHVLKLAVEAGAILRRPARVKSIDVRPFDSRITFTHSSVGVEQEESVRCRWLLDASGRACVLGKQLKLIEWNEAHPIAAIWARWNGVRHIDDLLALQDAHKAGDNIGSRRLATNHYIGHGFWIWVIPLGNGQTSIGLVFDKRIHQVHERPDRLAAYTEFLHRHPALSELLQGATPDWQDLRSLSRLAYCSKQYAGEGWALIGDAAAFIDPYYSPGLDHAAFTAEATTRLILADAADRSASGATDAADTAGASAFIKKVLTNHNATFLRSYRYFFRSVYRDKYFTFGEHDLASAAFLLDTAFYYIFVIIPAYRGAKAFVPMPVMGPAGAYPFCLMLAFMKWRFNRIAALRRCAGRAGCTNDRRRIKALYNLGLAPTRMTLRALKIWLLAEANGLRLRLGLLVLRQPAPGLLPSDPLRPMTSTASNAT